MKKIYRNSLKNQFRHYWGLIIDLIGVIVFIIFMIYKYGKNDFDIYLIIGMIVFSIVFIPTMFLHIQYLSKSKHRKLIVDTKEQLFIYETKNKQIVFKTSDIKTIRQYKTRILIENAMYWMPFSTYNYSELELNNGKKIIITCYLVSELYFEFLEDKIEVKKTGFPYIR